ncbi:MAG: hypothetical protein ACI9W2_004768, partial [Gammaproteobacteria bacterium]
WTTAAISSVNSHADNDRRFRYRHSATNERSLPYFGQR